MALTSFCARIRYLSTDKDQFSFSRLSGLNMSHLVLDILGASFEATSLIVTPAAAPMEDGLLSSFVLNPGANPLKIFKIIILFYYGIPPIKSVT